MSGGVGQDGTLIYSEERYIEKPLSGENVRLFINKLDNQAYLKYKNGSVVSFPVSGGGSDKNYVLNINVPATTWNVPHNLNKRCSVQVLDDAFNEVEASVHWSDNNEVIVTFNKPTTGWVYCN